jgi:hypothetical protein
MAMGDGGGADTRKAEKFKLDGFVCNGADFKS